MFEATGWTLEEPEVADQEKHDLMVPTIVKSPGGSGHDEVSQFSAADTPLSHCCYSHNRSVGIATGYELDGRVPSTR
jgi:hypothetical protein